MVPYLLRAPFPVMVVPGTSEDYCVEGRMCADTIMKLAVTMCFHRRLMLARKVSN